MPLVSQEGNGIWRWKHTKKRQWKTQGSRAAYKTRRDRSYLKTFRKKQLCWLLYLGFVAKQISVCEACLLVILCYSSPSKLQIMLLPLFSLTDKTFSGFKHISLIIPMSLTNFHLIPLCRPCICCVCTGSYTVQKPIHYLRGLPHSDFPLRINL